MNTKWCQFETISINLIRLDCDLIIIINCIELRKMSPVIDLTFAQCSTISIPFDVSNN